jgi:hypothetical protein
MEDRLLDSLWLLRMERYALRTHECPGNLPAVYERHFLGPPRHLSGDLS